MNTHITISGTADSGARVAGRVVLIGPMGASVHVDGLGARFIARDAVTRVFCRKLGGVIDYDAAVAAFRA